DWHDQNTVFSSMAAVSGGSKTLLTASGPERIPGQAVTSEFLTVLGVKPIAGRPFAAQDERDRASVALISERMWRTRFGADPGLLGRTIRLDAKPYTVI